MSDKQQAVSVPESWRTELAETASYRVGFGGDCSYYCPVCGGHVGDLRADNVPPTKAGAICEDCREKLAAAPESPK